VLQMVALGHQVLRNIEGKENVTPLGAPRERV